MTEDSTTEPDRQEDSVLEPANDKASSEHGIFSGQFEAYRTVTEDEYRAVLTSGLIVLDTSTMLDLYRYHSKTREELIRVLGLLKGRVWVAHHAMSEFFKNRLSVIDDHAKDLSKAIGELNGCRATVDGAVRTWGNRVSLPLEQRQEIYDVDLKPIFSGLDSLIDRIRKISDDHAFENASDTAQDPVISALNEILTDGAGEPLPEEEFEEAKKRARQRIEDKIPPGWKDADKKANKEGDYLVWYQTLLEAKRRGTDVLFVTSDIKEDWWRRERGELKGPLPELVREMRAFAGVRLYMLRPASLLSHAGTVLGVEISKESVQDAERVTILDAADVLAEWTRNLRSNSTASLPGAPAVHPRESLSRWRYTSNGFDLGSVANLSQKSFSHPSHILSYEKKLPAFRVGAFVACDSLSGDDLTADYLRSRMREILSQPALLGFIAMLTGVHVNAHWQSQPGRGRFNLEADVMSPDTPDIPAASAFLLMPESGLSAYGRNPDGAELYLHVNLPVKTHDDGSVEPESADLTKWYQRFTSAFRVPEILAQFLESIGLAVHEEPWAKFAVQIQGRVVNQLGIEELVDFGGLEALTPLRHSVQFDGWAAADPAGKPPGAVAKRFLTELCESVGRTGYGDLIARLPN